MSLADAVAAFLPDARAEAESLMQDTCQVRSSTDRTTQNEETGLEDPIFDVLYTSPCKVAGKSAASADATVRTVNVGGVERAVIESGVHLPVSDRELREGLNILVTAVGPMSDPSLLGKQFQVVGFGGKSWGTARRVDVVEV